MRQTLLGTQGMDQVSLTAGRLRRAPDQGCATGRQGETGAARQRNEPTPKVSPVLRRLGTLLGVSSPSLAERGPPWPGRGMRRGGGARLV